MCSPKRQNNFIVDNYSYVYYSLRQNVLRSSVVVTCISSFRYEFLQLRRLRKYLKCIQTNNTRPRIYLYWQQHPDDNNSNTFRGVVRGRRRLRWFRPYFFSLSLFSNDVIYMVQGTELNGSPFETVTFNSTIVIISDFTTLV